MDEFKKNIEQILDQFAKRGIGESVQPVCNDSLEEFGDGGN